MKLLPEIFNEIAAKIVKEGERDDLVKFMLAGKEPITAVQHYFKHLEARKKKILTLNGDEWFFIVDPDVNATIENIYRKAKKHTGLPLFKLIAPLIIPHVKKLRILNTQLKDYSFLADIKNLLWLKLRFATDEYIKVLSGLSSLQAVRHLSLNINGFHLQSLSSLGFSFDRLDAKIVFETNLKCDKVFHANFVLLYGDEEAMNDFVFNRQNYQDYAAIFPSASEFAFNFYMKVPDALSDFVKVSNPNHAAEVQVPNRNIQIRYHFFDYFGYPDSSLLKMLQYDVRWNTRGCPYMRAELHQNNMEVTCNFPLAIDAIGNKLAEKPLHRIPQNSNGNPDDYHRVTIENEWEHETEFELLKSLSIEALLEAYGQITGINPQNLRCDADLQNISNGDRIEIWYAG